MFRRVVVLLALLAAAGVTLPASPVQVSYVYSDSMEPTIGEDDGYVVVPAGEIERGDVVTFWSPSRGEYVTHRVVGRTDAGFVTRGDNNPTTDQAAGHPAVPRDRIAGEVLTVGGNPLVIPGLGHAAEFVATYRPLVVAAAVVLLLAGLLGDRDGTTPERSVLYVGDLLQPLFLVVLLATVAMVTVGATHAPVTYVASEGGSPGENTLAVGEPANETVVVRTGSVPLTRRVVDVDGMTVTDSTHNGSAVVVEARIPPPERPGPHETAVSVYRYPAVLPAGVQRSLHAVHPALAAAVTALAGLLPLALAYGLLVDGAAPLRSRGGRSTRRGRP